MYVDSNYLDYDNIVEFSDNYVVLSKVSQVSATFDSPRTIPVIIQYFTPSTLCIETTRTYRSYTEFSPVDVTDSYWDRPDVSLINLSVFFIVILTLFIFNQVTEFIYKGGLAK